MGKGLQIKKWENSRGFTLLEVMIAMFILTVALLGLISVTVMVIKGNDFSKRMTTATTLAMDRLERVKNMSPHSSIAVGVTTDYLNDDSSSGTAGSYFTRKVTVWDSTPAANMKTIEVEVSWYWLVPRTVTLRTIIAA